MRTIFLAIVLLTALTGCASNLPPVMLMPKTVDSVSTPLVSSSFEVAPVTLQQGEVEDYLSAENFKVALEETLKRANMFGSDTNKPYGVNAHVLEGTFPAAGITMSSTLAVRYTINNGAGREVLKEDVRYEGRADMSEEFLGSSRALLAFQRTQQGHFSLLLDKLKQALKTEATRQSMK